MFVLFLIIISLLLVGGSICYAWKVGVNDTALFLMGIGATFALYLLLLSTGNVWLK